LTFGFEREGGRADQADREQIPERQCPKANKHTAQQIVELSKESDKRKEPKENYKEV
jgi:hypothetical protein